MKLFKFQLLIFFFLFALNTLTAQQSKEERKIAAVAEKLIGDIKYVEPGIYTIYTAEDIDSFPPVMTTDFVWHLDDSLGWVVKEENDFSILMSPTRRDSSKGFYISKTEVTNKEYRQFVNWVIDSIAHTLMGHTITYPDGTVAIDWNKKLDWKPGSPLDVLFYPSYHSEEQNSDKRNIDIRQLVYASKKRMPIRIYPDTLCWTRDFSYSYNEPMARNYWNHPAYEDYPVVGINWDQAMAYCEWKSVLINNNLLARGLPSIELRLPYEKEWEAACIVPIKTTIQDDRKIINFPWDKYTRSFLSEVPLTDSRGNYRANFGSMTDISGFSFKDYTDRTDFVNNYPKRVLKNPKKLDKFHKKQIIKAKIMQQKKHGPKQSLFTSEVKTFDAYNGLYDMAGNVEEWTMDSPDYTNLHNEIKFYCFWDEYIPNSQDSIIKAPLDTNSVKNEVELYERYENTTDYVKNAIAILKMDVTKDELYAKIIKSIEDNDFELFSKIITAILVPKKIQEDRSFRGYFDSDSEAFQSRQATEKAKAETNRLIYKWWKEAQTVKPGGNKQNLYKSEGVLITRKIAKGGSWASGLSHLLIASARAYEANRGYSFLGFRVAFSIDKKVK
jgi:formylglycine-generating enzyme required for sulfatase activity